MKIIEKCKEEIKSLKQENTTLKRALSEKSEDPASKKKKKKIQLVELDPFKVLNEYCISEILKYINGFDFYQMTEVSQRWKSIVENDKRAAAELKKIQTLSIKSYKDVLKEVVENRDIKYKHVCIELRPTINFQKFVTPAVIETLRINTYEMEWDELQPENFAALRKLTFKEDYGGCLDWIAKEKFPALTSLKCVESDDIEDLFWIKEINFNTMPKLKRLHLQFHGLEEKLSAGDIKFIEPNYRLETLVCRLYIEKMCKPHSQTLTELKCSVLDFLDLENLLLNLTNLKSLSIKVKHFRNYRHEAPFPLIRNYNITKLEYGPEVDTPPTLFPTLTSLPEIETLILHDEITRDLLELAGEQKKIEKTKKLNKIKYLF